MFTNINYCLKIFIKKTFFFIAKFENMFIFVARILVLDNMGRQDQ